MNPFAALSRSLSRRRTLEHLRQLDDHLLADIGLTPEDVRRVAGRRADFTILSNNR